MHQLSLGWCHFVNVCGKRVKGVTTSPASDARHQFSGRRVIHAFFSAKGLILAFRGTLSSDLSPSQFGNARNKRAGFSEVFQAS